MRMRLNTAQQHYEEERGSHDRASLDVYFATSGWSPRAPRTGPIPDWCGMAAATWLVAEGMAPAHAQSFLHTRNVVAFFTYGDRENVRPQRLRTTADGQSIREWQRLYPRQWGIRPSESRRGDVIIFDWGQGLSKGHIALVWEVTDTHIICIEGNRSGLSSRKRWRASTVRFVQYRLDDKRIFGIGRLSPLDFSLNVTWR